MNAFSSLLLIALFPSTQPAIEPAHVISVPATIHAAIDQLNPVQAFTYPDRGIPDRRRGGGTR